MISDCLVQRPPGSFFSLSEKEYKQAIKFYPSLFSDPSDISYDGYLATAGINVDEQPRKFNPTTGPTRIRSDFMRISVKPMNFCRNPGNDPTSDP